jgi:hypothetical protein
MDLIYTPIGVIGLATLVAVYFLFAAKVSLQGVSLPCMTVITSFIYFYLMPLLALVFGGGLEEGFFGMYINSLVWPHFAVFLYTIGAAAAFVMHRRRLVINPALPRARERQANWKIFYLLCAVTLAALVAQTALGKLNITGSVNYVFAETAGNLSFINLFFTSMITLTIVYLIRTNFSVRSLIVLAVVMLIFLQIGFRFRILILASGTFASYMLIRGWKIRTVYIAIGSTVGIFLSNVIVNARKYGAGIDLSLIKGMSFTDIFQSFGGEVGPIYVITDIASKPLPGLVYFEPWTVGLARLIPSFLWPEKPTAGYFQYFIRGFWDESAAQAGIAAPQQVEMLVQFGWFGLPFLAFLYFSFAAYLVSRMNLLSREARIAGCALAPIFFGFYMQSRGYFSQVLSDGLFLFGPLFLMHYGTKVRRRIRKFIPNANLKG